MILDNEFVREYEEILRALRLKAEVGSLVIAETHSLPDKAQIEVDALLCLVDHQKDGPQLIPVAALLNEAARKRLDMAFKTPGVLVSLSTLNERKGGSWYSR